MTRERSTRLDDKGKDGIGRIRKRTKGQLGDEKRKNYMFMWMTRGDLQMDVMTLKLMLIFLFSFLNNGLVVPSEPRRGVVFRIPSIAL